MHVLTSIEIGQRHFSQRLITTTGCEAIVAGVLETLGITNTQLTVVITENPVFFTANGQPCDFPRWLPAQVNEYMAARDGNAAGADSDMQYWTLLITQIIWLQPAVLLPFALTGLYLPPTAQWTQAKLEEVTKAFYEILVELLETKISLADKDLIISIAEKHLYTADTDWNGFREELVEKMSTGDMAICCNRDYFNQVIKAGAGNNIFEQTRTVLLNTVGIVYPDCALIFDDALPYHFYRFRVNHFYSMPVQGMHDANEVFANFAPEELAKMDISARPTTNPIDGFTCSIISRNDGAKKESAGFVTLEASDYFTVCFNSFLQQHGYCTITNRALPEYLERAKDKYPELVDFFAPAAAAAKLVKTLRLLAREELPLRQYSIIMEGLLESDYVIANEAQLMIADERIPAQAGTGDEWMNNPQNLLAFVRIRLKRQIGYLYSGGKASIPVYQVDIAIEDMLDPELNGGIHTPGADLVLAIRAAIDKKIAAIAPGAPAPILLTSITARPRIKKIIAPRFPRITVLAYQELPPEVKIAITDKIVLEH